MSSVTGAKPDVTGDTRRRVSVEQLLCWAYAEQKVHLSPGIAWPSGLKIGTVYGLAALGTTVQGKAGENKVAPDALEVEAALQRRWHVTPHDVVLAINHAIARTRPGLPVAPRAVVYRADEFGHPLDSQHDVAYLVQQTRKGRTQSVACHVACRWEPSADLHEEMLLEYMGWRECLRALLDDLRPRRLERYVLTSVLPDVTPGALCYADTLAGLRTRR